MSKKSMIALIEAWEDQRDQYGTMKDFVDAFYRETKKKTESKTRDGKKTSSEKKEEGDEESEGSNEVVDSKTPRIKVNLLVPSSTKKKTESKTRAKKIVTEMGEETETESRDVKKERKPSKYLDFLKQWRVDNPGIKGKEAIKQGAAAWQEHKKQLFTVG
jgi:hypothetical protein